jgi:uncharacterized protein YkwD
MRVSAAAAVIAVGLLAAACGVQEDPPPPGCPGAPPDPIAATVLNRTNADRGARGFGGLSWNARLACLAQEWSAVQAGNGTMAHRDLGAVIASPGFGAYSGLAENVFVGPGSVDGNGIHGAWMNSPPHFNNIMGNYDSMGFGWAKTGDNSRLFATEYFGRHK